MQKHKTVFFWIVLMTGLLMLDGPVLAAKSVDILTGMTTAKRRVINSNIQQAKKNAVDDALDLALQNAFASLVSREAFASNLDFFYNRILRNASDYILAYRVLAGVENKGYFLVGVETKVDRAKLEKILTDARILNPEKDKPTLLLFIAEKTPDDLLPRYWWGKNPIPYQSVAERVIVSQLLADRYFMLGTGLERPDPSYYNVQFGTIYDITAAKKLGREMKADMVVFGKAEALEAINRMGDEKTFNARIHLEAYNVETGEKAFVSGVETVVTSDVVSQGLAMAIENAAQLSVADLEEKISQYWIEQLRKEHAFEVKIEGQNFLPRFIALKQRFQQMPEIENLQPKEMGSNFALLEVFYKGNPSQFAASIMLKTFEDFGIEILDVTDSLVTIRFIEKGGESIFKSSDQVIDEDQTASESEQPEQPEQP